MTQPDFSGIWRLIQHESKFGYLVPPRFRVDTIEHRDSHIRILTQQIDSNGDVSVERRLTLCGDEIVMGTRSDFNGYSRLIEDRRRIAADGQSITILRRHELPGGAVKQTRYCATWTS